MRALTLYPHWAHAVCWHGKRIENRARPIPRGLVGQRIALHAGVFRPGTWWDDVRAASGGTVPRGVAPWPIDRNGPAHPMAPHLLDLSRPTSMQCRAIVATAVLMYSGPPSTPAPRWADPDAKHWWFFAHVQVLPKAIPHQRGQLGLWRLPEDVAARLEAA